MTFGASYVKGDPMPNHLRQHVSILSDPATLLRVQEFLQGLDPLYPPQMLPGDNRPLDLRERRLNRFCFNSVIPLPVEYAVEPWDPFGCAAERKCWGVKWGSYDVLGPANFDGHITYKLTTAWSSPKPVYEKLSSLFGVTILVSFGGEVYDKPWREVYHPNGSTVTEPSNLRSRDGLLRSHEKWVSKYKGQTSDKETEQ